MSKKKYHFTPAMDAEIREIYEKAVGMSGYHRLAPVKTLAKKFGIPRWVITRRAGQLGIRKILKKESAWTPQELRILKHHTYKQPETIQRQLRNSGYERSIQGIVLKRKRMRFLSNMEFETAHSLSECLGVDEKSITRYIKKGLLKARRRGTKRTLNQGGDHWMIKNKDIRHFIINNVSILDFRKIDRFWLVDLLTDAVYSIVTISDYNADGSVTISD
jgi:hypothetical protein